MNHLEHVKKCFLQLITDHGSLTLDELAELTGERKWIIQCLADALIEEKVLLQEGDVVMLWEM